MIVYFRADASLQIGSGHVMRCLALADELKERGGDITFLCKELNGSLAGLIKERSFRVLPIDSIDSGNDAAKTLDFLKKEKQAVDWLVIDHYGLDARWEKGMRPFVKKIMVIDDLADRDHDCDLLLDQNFYRNMGKRYDGLVPDHCHKLLGPRFSLLRREFKEARPMVRKLNIPPKRILVFLGGSDLTNETLKVLKAISSLDRKDIAVDVITGAINTHKDEIEKFAKSMTNVTCYHNVNNMAELMLSADLYIGAAGITTWERCCLALPSLIISIADNQIEVSKYMAERNLVYYIGNAGSVEPSNIKDALNYSFQHPEILRHYADACFELVDGSGVSRCVNVMINR